jgi:thiol-disulfide isomerase/thioredoxin
MTRWSGTPAATGRPPRGTAVRAWYLAVGLVAVLAAACSGTASPVPASTAPEWFALEMTDVRTGESFSVDDFAGKVVLIETMAQWCPTCLQQEDEVRTLHELLGEPEDLVSISLDVDLNEDEASLKEYAATWGYDWRFAVSPLLVSRALGNLYSAQYLNPPLAPMLVIDRDGNAIQLPYGVKSAATLRKLLDPYLAP